MVRELGVLSLVAQLTAKALKKQKAKTKRISNLKMSAYYATRRLNTTSSSATWMRNRNAVRHDAKKQLGPISHTIFLAAVVCLIGLLALTQSAKVVQYDLNIATANSEISDLEAQRDALAVENAKITAAAADEGTNAVASTMVEANSGADFVSE